MGRGPRHSHSARLHTAVGCTSACNRTATSPVGVGGGRLPGWAVFPPCRNGSLVPHWQRNLEHLEREPLLRQGGRAVFGCLQPVGVRWAMGCSTSVYAEDESSSTDYDSPQASRTNTPAAAKPKKKVQFAPAAAALAAAENDQLPTLTAEEVELEADAAIAKARRLMSSSAVLTDGFVVHDLDDDAEVIDLDQGIQNSTTATASEAAKLAEEAAQHAMSAAYHRAVADGEELPQQWRGAGTGQLEELADAPGSAPAAPPDGETEKERKKREKREAKEAEKAARRAEKAAEKEQRKAEKAEAKAAKAAAKADQDDGDVDEAAEGEDRKKKRKKKKDKHKGQDNESERTDGDDVVYLANET